MVSAPAPPDKVLAAPFPMMMLFRAFPKPLVASLPSNVRFSTLSPKVNEP